jgi:hypothetical protein
MCFASTILFLSFLALTLARPASAQTAGRVIGRVTDETGGALPGVTARLRAENGATSEVVTTDTGEYTLDRVPPGRYQVSFSLINFATLTRRDVMVRGDSTRVDGVMHLALNAEVTVTGKTIGHIRAVSRLAERAFSAPPRHTAVGAADATAGSVLRNVLLALPVLALFERHDLHGGVPDGTQKAINRRRAPDHLPP